MRSENLNTYSSASIQPNTLLFLVIMGNSKSKAPTQPTVVQARPADVPIQESIVQPPAPSLPAVVAVTGILTKMYGQPWHTLQIFDANGQMIHEMCLSGDREKIPKLAELKAKFPSHIDSSRLVVEDRTRQVIVARDETGNIIGQYPC